jgi:hypothetical protein
MMILNYESKKELKENIGNRLRYTETSFFGEEYQSNGTFAKNSLVPVPLESCGLLQPAKVPLL